MRTFKKATFVHRWNHARGGADILAIEDDGGGKDRMKIARLSLFALLWVPCYLVELVLWLLGWIIVPTLATLELWRFGGGLPRWRPRWARLWGNDEDGIFGPSASQSPSTQRWIERARYWSLRRRAISWCALRNPVSNLRWSRWGCYLNSDHMDWIGIANPWAVYKDIRKYDPGKGPVLWCLARQGWRVGLWAIWPLRNRKHTILRLGWGVWPGYRREIERYQSMKLQFRFKSEDGDWWDA